MRRRQRLVHRHSIRRRQILSHPWKVRFRHQLRLFPGGRVMAPGCRRRLADCQSRDRTEVRKCKVMEEVSQRPSASGHSDAAVHRQTDCWPTLLKTLTLILCGFDPQPNPKRRIPASKPGNICREHSEQTFDRTCRQTERRLRRLLMIRAEIQHSQIDPILVHKWPDYYVVRLVDILAGSIEDGKGIG